MLTWEFTQQERIRAAVGATVRQQGASVTATGQWPQATIQPGGSAYLAFLGTAPQRAGTPTGFALNGVECSVR